jgi:pimeloyl-ACP methyl ester carboxylesterase
MTKHVKNDLSEYITPLNMNGLQGRMLRLPASSKKTKEILFVYGHHSTIGQWIPVINELSKYGTVTVPDLPGFGGMRSLYKIHEKPSIDELADYLASFIKLRYKRRRVTIFGWSFGFVVATRMLQRYPDLAKKVDLLVSLGGFSHYDDFVTNPRNYKYNISVRLFKNRLLSWRIRHINLQSMIWHATYDHIGWYRKNLKTLAAEVYQYDSESELQLWRLNDVRTHMTTLFALRRLDNCKKQLDIPLWHLSIPNGFNMDEQFVVQHLLVIFNDFHTPRQISLNIGPSDSDNQSTLSFVIPASLRRILAKD